jgi:hypothetical protein
MPLRHDWLDDGSLLMLLPEALRSAWRGIATTDYDRACEVASSWLASLHIDGGLGLLLGGDPGMALLIPGACNTLKLVRWHYADEEDELIEFALQGEAVSATEPDLVFENEHAAWVMFNAAADPIAHRPPMRYFELPVSRIRVTTAFLESERNAAIVHTIRPDAFYEPADVKPPVTEKPLD